jgi:enoyl-CoA hydratase/carnithine racemase
VQPVLRSLSDGVLNLTLNRPDKKNALDLETIQALRGGIAAAEDDAVRVVVLRAAGDVFCAGGDLEVMRRFAGDPMAPLERLRGGLNRLVVEMHALPKPIVARVQGNAYGAGALLAFQCDLPLAASEAQFAMSFRHVGLIPDTGGTHLLPRILGMPRAKHLIWTGAAFSADEAAAWGLVLRSVGRLQLDADVDRLVAALADGPVATMGLAKLALHRNLGASEAEALEREARLQAQAFLGKEHAVGRDAFFARKRPDFRN